MSTQPDPHDAMAELFAQWHMKLQELDADDEYAALIESLNRHVRLAREQARLIREASNR